MTSSYAFATEPMAHQRAALRKILETRGRTMLAMEPGTGKTKVALDYMGMLATKFGAQRVLVTAPLSALDTWELQADLHLPPALRTATRITVLDSGSIVEKAEAIRDLGRHDGIDVVVVNHDAFGSRAKVKGLKTVTVADRITAAVQAWDPDVAVIDEIHRFKSISANRSRALLKAITNSGRRLGLTGTVAPRNLLDVYGQWALVQPVRWGPSYSDFAERYAAWGGWEGKQIIGWRRLGEFRRLMLKDAYIARKADCLDLPEVTDVEVAVRLSAREQRAYTEMARDMVATVEGGAPIAAPSTIVKMLRLRQLTGGFIGGEDLEGGHVERRLGDSKIKVCRDKVQELVDAGEKVVVFAHFRADLEGIHAALRTIPSLKHSDGWLAKIDGSTPQSQRVSLRRGFAAWGGPAVMVAQMRTMSLAVNELVCASHAVFFSLSERRDDYDQARDRLNRLGQTRPVTFWHLVVPRSIDTLMLRAHRDKLALEHAVTDLRADLGLIS